MMTTAIGCLLDEITTPALIVDKEKVKRNCSRMLNRCRELGLKLRAHTKTHKTIEGVDIQTDGTRRCLVCSTLAECEFFAQQNCDDILYGIPLQVHHFERVSKLTRDLSDFHVMTDSPEIVSKLVESDPPPGKKWSVFLPLDCGYGREGIWWDDWKKGVNMANKLNSSGKAIFKGIYTHCGSTYNATSPDDLQKLQNEHIDRVLHFAVQLEENGVHCETFGIGSTPSCSQPSHLLSKLNEVHPGNYIFYDVQEFQLGSCSMDDIAVSVATRVIGHYPEKNQILIDCGFTALTKQGWGHMDSGYAVIRGEPNLKLSAMTQEIGFIHSIDGVKLDFNKYPLGSMLFLFPWHSCATACQYSKYLMVEDGVVKEIWKTAGGW